jgi:hypothetical protein
LAAHGYLRATIDIDLLVPGNAASGQRINDALMVLPDRATRDLEPECFAEGQNIRVADAMIVDRLLNANRQTFDTLRHYTQTIGLDGNPVKTVSLEGLLITKQAMRDKDVHDRILIERALNILGKNTNDLQDIQKKLTLSIGTITKQAAKPHFRTHAKEKGTRRCLFILCRAGIRQQPAP